jgi:hypothetical protein
VEAEHQVRTQAALEYLPVPAEPAAAVMVGAGIVVQALVVMGRLIQAQAVAVTVSQTAAVTLVRVGQVSLS